MPDYGCFLLKNLLLLHAIDVVLPYIGLRALSPYRDIHNEMNVNVLDVVEGHILCICYAMIISLLIISFLLQGLDTKWHVFLI